MTLQSKRTPSPPTARVLSAGLALACVLLNACATPAPIDLDAEALAKAMSAKPVVLLGEVHDNAAQHAARAAALRQLLRSGARPALAFEQFDRERQADIDRARRETPPAGMSPPGRPKGEFPSVQREGSPVDPPGRPKGEFPGAQRELSSETLSDHVIAQARTVRDGWDWALYRPFIELALDYELPIVAANLSRADGARAASQGFGAVFDAATIAALRLDALPPAVVRAQERAIDEGHCRQLPRDAVTRLARSQIARDAALALAIRPHLDRGVVLLTGNGHARNDAGVPIFLSAAERARTVTIGLLEDQAVLPTWRERFDVVFVTPTQPRADPCASFKRG